MVETLGLVSGALSALSILPQIYKNVRSGSSTDISTQTIVCAYVALGLGTVYGFMIDHMAVYVSDLTILGFYVVLHGVKIWNDRRAGADSVKNRVLYAPTTPPWPPDPTTTHEDVHRQVCSHPAQVRTQA
jgi:uncharacterized protein with PQ loop repeat